MPIHDLGYRGWDGVREPRVARWTVIADTGIRLTAKSRWLRRLLLLAWLPVVYLAVLVFAYEQSLLANNVPIDMLLNLIPQGLPDRDVLAQALAQGASPDGRYGVWAWLLMTYFRYPQAVVMVLVVGLIAPPLIAQDVRSRAFLLYFSRPLTRLEYILGKGCTVAAFVLMVTTVPALAMYALAVGLSQDLHVLKYTWSIPFRIVGASVVLALPTTALALFFSSMTKESRYAVFAWFAVWIAGWVAYTNLTYLETQTHHVNRQQLIEAARLGSAVAFQELSSLDQDQGQDPWRLLSLYHTLGDAQLWVFGFESRLMDTKWPALLLGAITVVSIAIVFWRVSSPMRI